MRQIIVHSKQSALSTFGASLWDPLFDICEAEGDAARNVAAECLGKLSVSDPAKYLPRLQVSRPTVPVSLPEWFDALPRCQVRLQSPSTRSRLTSMSALRFTLTDTSAVFDEELGPFLVDFLSHIHDADLTVRAIALSALNSAAHNKAAMLVDVLPSLLPGLYSETVVDPKLVRYVEMGPFKHRVDDGLETRKVRVRTLILPCLASVDHKLRSWPTRPC